MFKQRSRSRTMRRELSNYILGLSVLTAIVFTVILFSYFERGLDSAARTTMLMEARAFEKRYLQDPSISPSSSNTTRVFLDNWQNAPELYQKLIPFEELEPGDFSEAEWSPHGPEQWQDLRYLIIYWHKLHDGRDLFVVTDFEANLLTAEEQQAFDQDFEKIPLYASVYLVAMLFVVWVYNRRINRYSQQLAGWAQQCGAGGGELHVAAGAAQQRLADFVLQRLDPLGNGGRRQIQLARGGGGGAQFSDLQEAVEIARVHSLKILDSKRRNTHFS